MSSSLSLSTGTNQGRSLDADDHLSSSSRYTLIDPNSDEERLMSGFVSISMNQHKEICGIHMGGKLGLKKEQLDICKKLAFNKVLELTDRVRQVVADYYKWVKHTEMPVPEVVSIENWNRQHNHNHRLSGSIRRKMTRRRVKLKIRF